MTRTFVLWVIVISLSLTGCVHYSIERLSKSKLLDRPDNYARIIEDISLVWEEVATIRVSSVIIPHSTEQLMLKLRKKASLLGCDGIGEISCIKGRSCQGTCLLYRPFEKKKKPTRWSRKGYACQKSLSMKAVGIDAGL